MRTRLDAIGITLSSLCLVHCLIVPLAILMLPALSLSYLENEWLHWGLLALALPISSYAFWQGLRCHKCWHPGLLGASGLLLLVSGVLFPTSEIVEVSLTVAGASLLAIGHVTNRRLTRLTVI